MGSQNVIKQDVFLHSLEEAFSSYIKDHEKYTRRGHLDYGFIYPHEVKPYFDNKGHTRDTLDITIRAHLKELAFNPENGTIIVPISVKVPEHYCKDWQSLADKEKQKKPEYIPGEERQKEAEDSRAKKEQQMADALNKFAKDYAIKLEESLKKSHFEREVKLGDESVLSKKLKSEDEEVKIRSYLMLNLEFNYNQLFSEDDEKYEDEQFKKAKASTEKIYDHTYAEIISDIVNLVGRTDNTISVSGYIPEGKFHIFMKSRGLMAKFKQELDKIVAANKRVLEQYEAAQ